MSKLMVVITKQNGDQEQVQVMAGASTKIKVQPNTQIHLEIDGQKVDGSQMWAGKSLSLSKAGKMLLVQVDEEPIVELEDYYLVPDARLYGTHWDASGAQGMELKDDGLQLTSEALAAAQVPESGGAVAALTPLLTSGSAVAAVGASTVVASGSGGSAPASVAKMYQVMLTLGPITDGGNGTKMVLYKADGSKLGDMTYNAVTKAYEYSDKTGYAGVVIAVAVDGDDSPDYMSEATGAPANMGSTTDLMAVATVTPAETSVTLNITSLTTLSGVKLGVVLNTDGTVQAVGQAGDPAQVSDTNAAVAKAVGLGGVDIVRTAPVTTINADGSSNMTASNGYGKVLAAMAGMDEIYGSIDATLSKLATGFAAPDTLNAALKTAILQGALVAQAQSGTQTALSTAIQGFVNADITKVVAPSSVVLKVPENVSASTILGKALVLDDGQSGVKYYLAGGADDGKFSLNSTTGEIKFWDTTKRDYEALSVNGSVPTYVVKVRATDAAGNSKVQVLNIKLQDVSEFSVTDITNTAQTPALKVTEGAPAGTLIGLQAYAKDADASNNTITYSLVTNAMGTASYAEGEFAIDASTGVVSTAKPLDYEAGGATRTLYVKATSADGTSKIKSFSVALNNVDDTAPTITNAADLALNENTATVVQLEATDPDTLNLGLISYSITGGADKALFEVVNGQLRFKAAPDFEGPASSAQSNKYAVEVSASDGGNKSAKMFSITVNDVAEAGPVLTVSPSLVAASDQTLAANLTSSSGKAGAAPTYSIAGGADAALFSISGNKLVFNKAPDFLNPGDATKDNVYEIDLKVSDATGSSTATTKITVADLTAPVMVSGSVKNGDIVLGYSDKSPLNEFSFPSNAAFTVTVDGKEVPVIAIGIEPNSMKVTLDLLEPVLPGQKISVDYNNSVAGSSMIQDNAGNMAGAFSGLVISNPAVQVSLQFDQAALVLNSNEGAVASSVLYQANVKKDGVTDTQGVQYSLDGVDNKYFVIDAKTGALSFKETLDFENPKDVNGDDTYQLKVLATYGAVTASQDVQVKVTDMTELPSEITSATYVPKAAASGGLTLNDALASLLSNDDNNASWAIMKNGVRPTNQAVTVTYSFMNKGQILSAGPGYGKPVDDQFSDADKALIKGVLKTYSDVSNITFVETESQDPLAGNMKFYMGSKALMIEPGSNFAAYAMQPSAANSYQTANAGDVFMVRELSADFNGVQNFSQTALMHEVGHALGLDHPFAKGFTYYTTLTDSGKGETVMSYNIGTTTLGLEVGHYDIAAMQHLYGANMKTNLTDTVYSYKGIVADTIWDAGGTDTIVQTGVSGAVIDLRPGYHLSLLGDNALKYEDYTAAKIGIPSKLTDFQLSVGRVEKVGDGVFRWWYESTTPVPDQLSVKITTENGVDDKFFSEGYSSPAYNKFFTAKLGTAYDSFAKINIAEGVTIENATGNIGNDVFYGNDAANMLTGNEGNDKFYATGLGGDTLSLGAGKDEVHYSSLNDLHLDMLLDFKSGEDQLFFDKLGLSQSSLKFDSASKILTVMDASANSYWLSFGAMATFDPMKDVVFVA